MIIVTINYLLGWGDFLQIGVWQGIELLVARISSLYENLLVICAPFCICYISK